MKKNHHINIFYSEADSGYIADNPDLEACSAYGKTPVAALKQVQLAKRLWLQAAKSERKPIPPNPDTVPPFISPLPDRLSCECVSPGCESPQVV